MVAVASRVCVCPRRRETQSGKSDDSGESGERASEQRPAGRLAGQAVRTPITAVVTIARRLVVINEALLALLILLDFLDKSNKKNEERQSRVISGTIPALLDNLSYFLLRHSLTWGFRW